MFTGNTLKNLAVMLAAFALVALGTQEFVHRQKNVAAQVETENVSKLITGLKGGRNMERAMLAPEQYEEALRELEARNSSKQSKLSQDFQKFKDWILSKLTKEEES